MSYQMQTARGHDFYECASAFQKSIRRNDPKIAGYFGLELFMSGYRLYAWKRLLTISAEDCAGIITKEIKSLYDSWELINKGQSKKTKGRIFFSKAVMILCKAPKDRDSDHLQCLIYDKKIGMTDQEIDKWLNDAHNHPVKIPDYTYDVHTRTGKMRGKTKEHFFRDENQSLTPKNGTLFDNLIP